MEENKITIVMPVHNGATTLREVFGSLEKQNNKGMINELFIINDNSTDDSQKIIEEYSKKSSFVVNLIVNEQSIGLAANYNKGIKKAKTDYVILMHQDVVLTEKNSFVKILQPFISDKKVLATYPTILHPYEIWKTYNFWQKCLFSRLVNKNLIKFTGKFDCIKKIAGLDFNSKIYRTAGEDLDYEMKCSAFGKVVPVDFKVIHIHNRDNNFSLKQFIKKESQLAECYGVNLRRYFKKTKIKDIIILVFRPIILLGLFVNIFFINELALLIILLFCFYYTKLVYLKCYKNSRVVILPFVNFVSLIYYSFYFVRGFIYAKQKI